VIGPVARFEDLGLEDGYLTCSAPRETAPTDAQIVEATVQAMADRGLVRQPGQLLGHYLMLAGECQGGDRKLARSRLYALAEPGKVLEAVRAIVDRIADLHGPGRVWFLDAPTPIALTADHDTPDIVRVAVRIDGSASYLVLRTYYGHEAQAVPL